MPPAAKPVQKGTVVYIVPRGYAYHDSPDCRTLWRSKVIKEVPLQKVIKKDALKKAG